jgi:hypothetical protein
MTKPYLGVWLDHREVYLIWISEDGEVGTEHATVDYAGNGEKSGLAKSAAAGVYGGLAPHADPTQKRHRQHRKFYDRIYRAARQADHVYIFGPGQAKQELSKFLEEHKDFNGRIRAVESAERMTEPQMVARVREFFDIERTAA